MGRPKGYTGKYKDEQGNPISVYEWRKTHHTKYIYPKTACYNFSCPNRIEIPPDRIELQVKQSYNELKDKSISSIGKKPKWKPII